MVKRFAFIGAAIAAVACQTNSETNRPDSKTSETVPATSPPGNGGQAGPRSPQDATSQPDGDADGAPRVPPPIVTEESLDVAGTARSFVLATPSTYDANKTYPLVLVLHGDGGDGTKMRAAFSLDAQSRGSAFVAYPTGTFGWNLYDPADSNPDLAYLVAIVDSLATRFTIDTTRVFGIGFSSGAFMLNQVGCRRPGLFRAIVPHSGGAPNEPRDPTASRWENDYTRCANQTLGSGPAVLVIHGTADAAVTFDSGDFTARYWAFINGCQASRSKAATPPPCVFHDACPTGKEVVFCPIDNLGHTVWNEAARAAWQFFSTF